ncbi:XRE family transcriptional regulator [Paenibacillus sp. 23TSA30-6]|uniref:XRE family transcriptional regulator n=1 Tax=Paenibacillus sp. 23TSA30-6 TaxID=2546104 RepID=UPI0017886181|nr:XRE family transcriptional regulator [Paenibacillus sp. 23TSA30-6]MBE0336436.1 XRE family transcriptional regulator [Paenibacillus sp. 23TSA30-6]
MLDNNKKHPVTPFGWTIKQKLVERKLDQKTFCETYQIPPARLSNLIHGTRKAKRHRKIVSQLLGIQDES